MRRSKNKGGQQGTKRKAKGAESEGWREALRSFPGEHGSDSLCFSVQFLWI